MQPEDELSKFMAGVRYAETNDPLGVYTASNPSGAYGAYQMKQQYWDSWASNAGYDGASIQDPAAQDAVAGWLMNSYYNTYGSWDLVATAWRLGPTVADRVQTAGWGVLTEDESATMNGYLGKVMPYVGTGPYTGPTTSPSVEIATASTAQLIPKMFDQMSQRVAGGQRLSIGDLTDVNEISAQGAGVLAESGNLPPAEGTLGFSEVGEGGETFDPAATGGSFNSPGVATHTQATNEARLNDTSYQGLATSSVTPVGEWLAQTFGVTVNQYRPLGVVPQGGAALSDHYWGGALDITGSVEQMSAVAAFLKENMSQLGLNYVLWQQENHYDHVHVSWLPPASEGAVPDATEALVRLGVEQSGAGVTVPQNVLPTVAEEPEPVAAGAGAGAVSNTRL